MRALAHEAEIALYGEGVSWGRIERADEDGQRGDGEEVEDLAERHCSRVNQEEKLRQARGEFVVVSGLFPSEKRESGG